EIGPVECRLWGDGSPRAAVRLLDPRRGDASRPLARAGPFLRPRRLPLPAARPAWRAALLLSGSGPPADRQGLGRGARSHPPGPPGPGALEAPAAERPAAHRRPRPGRRP